jgi:hypothetical protein
MQLIVKKISGISFLTLQMRLSAEISCRSENAQAYEKSAKLSVVKATLRWS